MKTREHIKHKIFLLIILAIAAGILTLTTNKSNIGKKINHNTPKVSQEKDTKMYNCDNNQDKTVAQNLKEGDIDLTDKTCLFIGCGGFTY